MNHDRRVLNQSGSSRQRQALLAGRSSSAASVVTTADYATFSEFASLLRRNKWVFSLFLAGGAIFAGLLSMTQTPMYQARALVEVEMPNEDFLNRRQLNPMTGPGMLLLEPFLQTQVKLMESDTMLLTIIDKLKLVQHREFNPTPSVLKQVKQRVTHKAAEASNSRSVLAMVRQRLMVRLFGQTQIVEIMFDASDPQLAADIVNALAEGYRAQALQRMVGSSTQTEQLLSGQIEEQKKSLVEAETNLRQFVSSNGLLVASNDKESFADAQLRQVQAGLGVAHDTRIASQSQYEMVRSANPESLGRMLDSDTLKSYRVKLAELQQQLARTPKYSSPRTIRFGRFKPRSILYSAISNRSATASWPGSRASTMPPFPRRIADERLRSSGSHRGHADGQVDPIQRTQARPGDTPHFIRLHAAAG